MSQLNRINNSRTSSIKNPKIEISRDYSNVVVTLPAATGAKSNGNAQRRLNAIVNQFVPGRDLVQQMLTINVHRVGRDQVEITAPANMLEQLKNWAREPATLERLGKINVGGDLTMSWSSVKGQFGKKLTTDYPEGNPDGRVTTKDTFQ